jgi:hypothetical protein
MRMPAGTGPAGFQKERSNDPPLSSPALDHSDCRPHGQDHCETTVAGRASPFADWPTSLNPLTTLEYIGMFERITTFEYTTTSKYNRVCKRRQSTVIPPPPAYTPPPSPCAPQTPETAPACQPAAPAAAPTRHRNSDNAHPARHPHNPRRTCIRKNKCAPPDCQPADRDRSIRSSDAVPTYPSLPSSHAGAAWQPRLFPARGNSLSSTPPMPTRHPMPTPPNDPAPAASEQSPAEEAECSNASTRPAR